MNSLQEGFDLFIGIPNPFTNEIDLCEELGFKEEGINEIVYEESLAMGVVSGFLVTGKISASNARTLRDSKDFFHQLLDRLVDAALQQHRAYVGKILEIIEKALGGPEDTHNEGNDLE